MNKIKNKKIIFLILAIIIIIVSVFLVICLSENSKKSTTNNNDKENIKLDEYYTITFETDGGSSIDSVVVKKGETLKKPVEPTKEGYSFINWQLDEEVYDFDLPVSKDITLKAMWEENKKEDDKYDDNPNDNKETNITNNSTTNNNSNNTSSTNKINLNNNISVTEYYISSGGFDCFYYMFPTNLQEVFPNASISKVSSNPYNVNFWPTKQDRTENEVSTEEINTYLSNGSLKINTTQETKLKNTLNKYKNGKYKGITNVTYEEQNHRFVLSYNYISFNGLNVNSIGEQANKEINNILSNATLFKETCGSFNNYQNLTLTEDLCNKYNLTCDRW